MAQDGKEMSTYQDFPPFVVMAQFPDDVVRVVAVTPNEMTCHDIARAVSDQGYRVWFIDLYGDEGAPRIELYKRPKERD